MAPSASVSTPPKSPSQPSKPQNGEVAKEEEDYLTMTFAEPSSSTAGKTETLTQARKRKQREAETRGRTKSKSELAAEEATKRDEALARSTLDPASKGFRMMAKLGYTPGTVLGKPKDVNGGGAGLLEPVGVEMKEGRGGVGADAEKKRKLREEIEAKVEGEKKRKVGEVEFRVRQAAEREERRKVGLVVGAQRVAEGLEEEEENGMGGNGAVEDGGVVMTDSEKRGNKRARKPLSRVNVLWRGAIKQRELAERDRRIRYDLHQSLSRLPTYEDADEEKEDKIALGKRDTEEVDLDLDLDDRELDQFDALESGEKLQTLVQYLRDRWHYCFWCKYRYEDSNMEGCPGLAEDDHD
jgi:Domain of unknown function (DUF4187)/G-patch domain